MALVIRMLVVVAFTLIYFGVFATIGGAIEPSLFASTAVFCGASILTQLFLFHVDDGGSNASR